MDGIRESFYPTQYCMNWTCKIIQTTGMISEDNMHLSVTQRLVWSLFATLYFLEHLINPKERNYVISVAGDEGQNL